jgi:hypothetical protein
MQESPSLSRRTALAGLGAGSLGLFFGTHAALAAAPNRETGSAAVIPASDLVDHPLTGLWLSLVALPSNPDLVVAVPTIFGADGSAVMIYPCTEANGNGVHIKGAAIGTWAPIDDRSAHFTTVQVLSDMDGGYVGTSTFDGYPLVSDDGQSWEVKSEFDRSTVRDASHAIVRSIQGPSKNPFHGFRMTPGNDGFPPYRTSLEPGDGLVPDPVDAGHFPEVAPVHPGDPRLAPTPTPPPPGGGLAGVQ